MNSNQTFPPTGIIINYFEFKSNLPSYRKLHSLVTTEVPCSSLAATEVPLFESILSLAGSFMPCRLVITVPKSRIFICSGVFEEKSNALVHLPLHSKNNFGLLMSNDFLFAMNMLLQVINSHLQRICCNNR